jgi:DNA-3-methyladenine glycosylase
MSLLTARFFNASTEKIARKLLGKILCVRHGRKVLKGRIVETEAYIGVEDRACHAFGGRRTRRTESLYQAAGSSYVYFIYGMYYCFNVVTCPKENPQAVLVRALTTLDGNQLMAQGPGKLCRALGIDRRHDRKNLMDPSSGIWLEDDGYRVSSRQIETSARIGVDYAGEAADWPLRFHIKDHPDVSRARQSTKSKRKGLHARV